MGTVLTGYHAIGERLLKGIEGTLFVSRTTAKIEELVQTARTAGVEVIHDTDERLSRLSGITDHRGVILEVKGGARNDGSLAARLTHLSADTVLVLVLDGITDPHNLGAVLRSADQFQVDLVILPARRSARDGETVAKTSAGADAYVPIVVVPNLVRALADLKARDFWIYGADLSGKSAGSIDLHGRTAIVMGAEGRGLGRLVSAHCDVMISIPTRGHVDSLNVSVAAGILLYEARRGVWT